MSATSFLIAHGEKLAVALVAAGCGFVLWNTFTDPSFQPKDNAQRVEDINRSIEEVFKNQLPPVMKEPRPYLDELLARIGEATPVLPTMSWLTTLPDMGKDKVDGAFIYAYELLAPTVTVKDVVGQLQITLELPEKNGESDGGAGRRISSAPDRTWARTDKGPVTNRARHLGVQVQVKVGKGDWQPLVLPGASKDGVLPLEGLGLEPITLPALEPWANHAVQARLIAGATAYDFDTREERPRSTVVVFPGRISTGPADDQRVIKTLADKKANQALRAKSLLPVDGPLPAEVKLEPQERVFLGPWSAMDKDASVDVTGNVRCALLGFTVEPLKEDAAKTRDVGKFLLVRLFQQGGEAKWLEKPLELKFGVGDRLEAKATVPNPFPPNKQIAADFSTPFVIKDLVKDQKRVLYWTVRLKSRQGGGKDRDLAIDKKEVPTDIVVLKNPDTGSELVLTKLIVVSPAPANCVLVYPYRASSQNERDDFVKAPSEFKQWGLVPEEPKAHQPGTGPLAELHGLKVKEGALDAASYTTDTTYYELADHRLVWWDTITKAVMKDDPKGIEVPTGVVPEAVAPVTPALPGLRPPGGPGRNPPGMPPGGMPDMPPEMPPGMPPGKLPRQPPR